MAFNAALGSWPDRRAIDDAKKGLGECVCDGETTKEVDLEEWRGLGLELDKTKQAAAPTGGFVWRIRQGLPPSPFLLPHLFHVVHTWALSLLTLLTNNATKPLHKACYRLSQAHFLFCAMLLHCRASQEGL
jgi:hypothetical protein